MNLENIEAFVYVVHYGGFNKAAEALYLAQPSVSARIQTLERELNCRLFHRSGKTIRLTEDGNRFYPYAQQLMMVYQRGKNNLNRQKTLPEELRIGCTVSASNYLMPMTLPDLRRKHPQLQCKLFTGTTDEVMRKLLAKEVDIGFVRNINHPNMHSLKFYEDPILLYVYDGHPFQQSDSCSIEKIAEEALVFFECGALDWHRIHRLFEHLAVPPNIQIQTDNSEMAKKLVIQKTGIGFLPALSVQNEVGAGLLHPVAVAQTEGISLQTNLIYPHDEQNPLVQEIIEIGKRIPTIKRKG